MNIYEQNGIADPMVAARSNPVFQSGGTNTSLSDSPIGVPNYNLGPALTTTFPQKPSGSMITPIVTSKAAQDHSAEMKRISDQANMDLQNHTQFQSQQAQQKQQADQQQSQQNIENKQNQQKTDASTSDSITQLVNELTGVQSTLAKPNILQKDVIDNNPILIDTMKTQLQGVSDSLKQMALGTYPLTTGQQAQVNNIGNQFASAVDAAKKVGQNQQNGQTLLNSKTGIQMYSPIEALSNIKKIIDKTQTKIGEINTKILDAQDKLTTAIQDGNFKYATQLYNDISAGIKDKTQELSDANKAVADATKEMHQNALDNTKMQLQAIMDDHTISYQDKAQAISQSQLDETKRHNMATELAQKQANGVGLTVPPVNMTADGIPNSQDQQAFLNSLPGGANGMVATMIKGLTSYQTNPAGFSTSAKQAQGGLTHSQIVALAQQYDPTYNEAQYATRQAYLKNVQSGQIYQGIIAANKSINHLIAFDKAVKDMKNSPISSHLNALGTNIEKPFNPELQKNQKTAQTEANGLKDELAKFFKGTGASDVKSIDDWGKGLNENATPGEQRGVVQGAINLLAGQLDVLNEQYKGTMGKASNNTFIQPATMVKLSDLKNQGYEVDIPGVNYTDKDAFLKYAGSDAQSRLNDAFTNLKNAGLPTTPDNILQAAQL